MERHEDQTPTRESASEAGWIAVSPVALLAETVKALAHTFRRLVRRGSFTVQYPEESLPPRKGYRGEHYLKRDAKGRVKCVACFMCAAACPARCITIEAGAAPPEWKDREKYPVRFEIDLLRCIYCGMCEEACPVDAIALSGTFPQVASSRAEKIYDRDRLLAIGDKLGDNISIAP
ncbi:MAG: NADH-quinone oxidoreductase subunit I [Planctomycetota bacterium]|nr:NADH-quinone oxidoreductase subunit I [Planctomycetota bacterium]